MLVRPKEADVPKGRSVSIPRFCLLFVVAVAVLVALSRTALAERLVHRPLCSFLAGIAALLLAPFGNGRASGDLLGLDAFWVTIDESCDGILATCIYLAAVLALPSSWRARMWGAIIGIPSIFLINLARIVTLTVVGARRPDLYEWVHIHVWQALVVALSMAVWAFWAERFVRPHLSLGR
jgi:exosortase H (IPTLxxWG-CTERM-specific)